MSHPQALVVDSSVWLEILTSGTHARSCQKEVEKADPVIVPTLVLFEVYKKLTQLTSEDQALSAVAMLSQHSVSDLTREVALTAADLAVANRLAMADSIVLAHAVQAGALLLTRDNDFSGLPHVRVIR